jgi:hypothetical protein
MILRSIVTTWPVIQYNVECINTSLLEDVPCQLFHSRADIP